MFDVNTFMNDAVDKAGSTQVTPIPAGEYTAIITEVEPKTGVSQKTGNEWVSLNVTWDIQNPELAKQLGREKLQVRQSVFLDMKDGKLDMDKGKNIGLNRLREALGQNVEGKKWSPNDLKGNLAKIKTKLVAGKNGDFPDVESVGKA